jgi:predicted neuraminidase
MADPKRSVVEQEFVFAHDLHGDCHASTIVEVSPDELVAAWFGGTKEGKPDISIWLARRSAGRWSVPVEVANGLQPDGKRHPTWNPVLFQARGSAPLMLFYKVGPHPTTWWGMLMTSTDGGKTWGKPRRLPDGILGPIKNKPVQLADGTILCPSSTESTDAKSKWRVHFEWTKDLGRTWETAGILNDTQDVTPIQPSILLHGGDRLQAMGRTRRGFVFSMWSKDAGRTWDQPTLSTLQNPNSGVDAVTLADGRHLIVYNHSGLLRPAKTGVHRSPLNVAISKDGVNWIPVVVLEDAPLVAPWGNERDFSYPAVIQATDGRVHITYSWKRIRIKHVVLNPAVL